MNEIKQIALKPGTLVQLRVSKVGGCRVRTRRTGQATDDSGAVTVETESSRTVYDPAEWSEAEKLVGRVGYAIRKTCTVTPSGLLHLAEEKAGDFAEAFEASKAEVAAFNAGSNYTKIRFYCYQLKVLEADEYRREIASEIAQTMANLREGLASGNVGQLDAELKKARTYVDLLDGDQALQVETAITQAASAKRTIKREIKNGKAPSDVAAKLPAGAIDAARFSFLEMAGETEAVESAPAADVARFDVDLSEDTPEQANEQGEPATAEETVVSEVAAE